MALTPGTVQVPPASTGAKIDTSELTSGANTVERQVINIGDPETAANVAYVHQHAHQDANADPGASKFQLAVSAFLMLFNGTAFDRIRSGAAAVLAAFSSTGAALVALPGQWSVVHLPATNTQATASKAAGAAGVRHVCTAFEAALASGSTAITVPATPVNVVVRDGASGAGTIIWQGYISAITTAGSFARLAMSGLNLVGTAATAMTVEFSAAGGVGTFESVSMSGYDCV